MMYQFSTYVGCEVLNDRFIGVLLLPPFLDLDVGLGDDRIRFEYSSGWCRLHTSFNMLQSYYLQGNCT